MYTTTRPGRALVLLWMFGALRTNVTLASSPPLDLSLPASAYQSESSGPSSAQTAPTEEGGKELPEVRVTPVAAGPEPGVSPRAPCGIAGLLWSLQHPTQAWRVVAPIPDADTHSCPALHLQP